MMSDQHLAGRTAVNESQPGQGAGLKAFFDDPRVLGWGSVALVLLIWEVSTYLSGVSPLYLPRPSQIVVALVAMFLTGGLATDLGVTLYRIFAGFAIAVVVGTLLGVWIAKPAKMRSRPRPAFAPSPICSSPRSIRCRR
jgi:NitT/TauT family transport system permease protein